MRLAAFNLVMEAIVLLDLAGDVAVVPHLTHAVDILAGSPMPGEISPDEADAVEERLQHYLDQVATLRSELAAILVT